MNVAMSVYRGSSIGSYRSAPTTAGLRFGGLFICHCEMIEAICAAPLLSACAPARPAERLPWLGTDHYAVLHHRHPVHEHVPHPDRQLVRLLEGGAVAD